VEWPRCLTGGDLGTTCPGVGPRKIGLLRARMDSYWYAVFMAELLEHYLVAMRSPVTGAG
jgi:hypothetical protein